MPLYCWTCDACGNCEELSRPMAAAGEPHACGRCGQPARRDYQAERKGGHAFNRYESVSCGVFQHVMRGADIEHVRRQGWTDTYKRQPDGSRKRLNPEGFSLNPKTGDVIVRNAAEKRRLLAVTGYTDYGPTGGDDGE